MMNEQLDLCGVDGCRRLAGHDEEHDRFPKEAWAFLEDVDQNKIHKAGYATPRGGHKGAYQNHVYRNGRVIVPFERLETVDLSSFKDGYVIRLYPEQLFESKGAPKPSVAEKGVLVGENAFVLYRSHESFEALPPLDDWEVRHLVKDVNGEVVKASRRSSLTRDVGHYVLRLPTLGEKKKRDEGPPQGIFAPEYSDAEANYLSQCVLAWLTVHTFGSPYTTAQAGHLRSILEATDLASDDYFERKGMMGHGLTKCPLCLRYIRHAELHSTVSFAEEAGLENASKQVEDTTRSTTVNLFHLVPLVYDELRHKPVNVAWGHAVCNTRLGQRVCYSLEEIQDFELKVGIVREAGIETFGWISRDREMIRSPLGAVWIQLHGDVGEFDPPQMEATQ